jgi:integrase
MSRPLTGSVTANLSGTFTASVPVARGSTKRKSLTFQTRVAAERWCRTCVAALDAAQPLPADARPGLTSAAVAKGTAFKTAAEEYVRERYVEDGHGNVDREDQVRRYIDAIDGYLRSQQLTLETTTRRHARQMFQHLLKTSEAVVVRPPEGVDPESPISKTEGRALLATHGLPVSDSTFKRAVRRGDLTPVDTTGRAHAFRVGDLFGFAAQLGSTGTTADGRRRRSSGRYAHSTLADVRRTFLAVLDYAESEGITLQPMVRAAKLPKNKTRKVKVRALTLQETARVAGRLHVVHQLVLWLLRVLGLRIGEAYGVLVEDVIDAGPGAPGLLTVQSQGGMKYRRRNADGTVSVTDRVEGTKADSYRIIVVPAVLMDLIRVVIDVFHTDQDGAVQAEARLIPGLVSPGKSGQSQFRQALKTAAAAEGLDLTFDKRRSTRQRSLQAVTPTPHHLRKAFATALEADKARIEDIRAVLGHLRGEEVIHQHYLLEDLDLKPQRAVAETLSAQIRAELGGRLLVPTRASCTSGRQPALACRAAEIDSALEAVGWLVTESGPAGDRLSVKDAAALRGVSAVQIRDDIRTGKLQGTKAPRVDQNGLRYEVVAADVLAACDLTADRLGMRELALELGVPYDRVRQYIRRSPDLKCEPLGDRDYHVPDDVAAQVRAYFLEQEALEARAVRLPEVARELGISVAAIKTLVKRGRLVEDVRFHGGIQSITRASLEANGRGGRLRQA